MTSNPILYTLVQCKPFALNFDLVDDRWLEWPCRKILNFFGNFISTLCSHTTAEVKYYLGWVKLIVSWTVVHLNKCWYSYW